MSRDIGKEKEATQKAFTELAQNLRNRPNKYNIGYQLSKMLSDYSLLDKIDLKGKKVLNIGCFEPVDEVFWVNLIKEWHALDINEEAIGIARKLASETLPPHLYSKLKFIVGDATNLDCTLANLPLKIG